MDPCGTPQFKDEPKLPLIFITFFVFEIQFFSKRVKFLLKPTKLRSGE